MKRKYAAAAGAVVLAFVWLQLLGDAQPDAGSTCHRKGAGPLPVPMWNTS